MHRLPQVQILDEQLINEDERFRAEIYYTESSVCLLELPRARGIPLSNLCLATDRFNGKHDRNVLWLAHYESTATATAAATAHAHQSVGFQRWLRRSQSDRSK